MTKNILLLLMLILSTVAFAQEESEPEFIDYFFTKKNGDTITGSVQLKDKIVFLNLITARAIGENVVLTMDENEEYFLNKQFLAEGSSVKFLIKEDIQKVKFVIYNPSKKKHVKRRKKQEEAILEKDVDSTLD